MRERRSHRRALGFFGGVGGCLLSGFPLFAWFSIHWRVISVVRRRSLMERCDRGWRRSRKRGKRRSED